MQVSEAQRSASERALRGQLRVLSRYGQQAEHEALIDGIVAEHHLRARIQARAQGCSSL